MKAERGARFLMVWVIVVTAGLVAASRWAGKRDPGAASRADPERSAARLSGDSAPGSEDAGDLGFYGALAGGRSPAPAAAVKPRLAGSAALEAPPAGAYVVQALATRDGKAARTLLHRLTARHLPATLVESESAGGPVFRVRVGRYRDRPAAEAVARKLRADHGIEPWVLREDG